MQSTATPRVKICCNESVEEAWLAIKYGASAIGLVSDMPSGPGVISEDLIREIAAAMPPGIATFLLTCKQDAAAIVEQQRYCGTNTIQICDRLEAGTYDHLRASLPGVALVQVIHVNGPESVTEAQSVAPHVDAILLDSGNQRLRVKELGGTGRTHDWELSRQIRESVPVPIYLAGGIKPENVRAAVDQVGPFAVDICTGVRTNGKLDEHKLQALFLALA
ncbi:MAG: phosphoribosylanthranilate isomerase [Blastocatellia bacterium]|jgi:phosphoribosylanthranilate isomerase|nr:phosphoribosylanthranilate isomerase [Blastocatellia bacterium]